MARGRFGYPLERSISSESLFEDNVAEVQDSSVCLSENTPKGSLFRLRGWSCHDARPRHTMGRCPDRSRNSAFRFANHIGILCQHAQEFQKTAHIVVVDMPVTFGSGARLWRKEGR